jgi:hypothetical protein
MREKIFILLESFLSLSYITNCYMHYVFFFYPADRDRRILQTFSAYLLYHAVSHPRRK